MAQSQQMSGQCSHAVHIRGKYRIGRHKGILMIRQYEGQPQPLHLQKHRGGDFTYTDDSQQPFRLQQRFQMLRCLLCQNQHPQVQP
ncbi:hypothetical protein D3C75_884690 [compost metagenome]